VYPQNDPEPLFDPDKSDAYRDQAPVTNPPGGFAAMPESAPGLGGDVPPMSPSRATRRFDAWNYQEAAGPGDGADIVGFRVEAIDGHIGKIDKSSTMVGESYLVVDTGPWILGKKVLLPAGTVNHVDSLDGTVYVDRTKTQIKNSPEYDPETAGSPEYRDKLDAYYRSTYD